mgnify:FL=1
MLNFRTDLASERRDLYKKANNNEEIDGIETRKRGDKWKYFSRESKNNKWWRSKSYWKASRRLYYNRYKETKNSKWRRNKFSRRNFIKRTCEISWQTYW